jgi:hypothetical protein
VLGQGFFTPLQGTYPETAQQSFLKTFEFFFRLLKTAQRPERRLTVIMRALGF